MAISMSPSTVEPRLEGQVGYRVLDNAHLCIDVERIHNPREPDNLSGTLSLELWALPEPYDGGDFQGHALGGMTLGTLAGNADWQNARYEIDITPPPDGSYALVLMLREWEGNGYLTRDHCNFDLRVTFPLLPPADQSGDAPIADTVPTEQGESRPVEKPPAQDSAKTPAFPAGKSAAPLTRLARWKQALTRAWVWLKQNW